MKLIQTKDETIGRLWYHRTDDGVAPRLTIDLVDVRAAASIRVTFDFPRNGWLIEKDSGDAEPNWREVAFVSGEEENP